LIGSKECDGAIPQDGIQRWLNEILLTSPSLENERGRWKFISPCCRCYCCCCCLWREWWITGRKFPL